MQPHFDDGTKWNIRSENKLPLPCTVYMEKFYVGIFISKTNNLKRTLWPPATVSISQSLLSCNILPRINQKLANDLFLSNHIENL